jgi:DNA-binding response OmpR family regulator
MKVLVAENEETTLELLTEILEKEGFSVTQTADGQSAINKYKEEKPDFICLDILMNDVSGYDVCKEIRKHDEETPVVFITSKEGTLNKVLGLELGADDYIIKPFEIQEVIARIRAIARRSISIRQQGKVDDFFQMQNILVFPNKLTAYKNDNAIDLSLREVKLLKLLHSKKNHTLHRDDLLDYCWGIDTMPESRIVDWHISQLRKKIEDDPGKATIIKTIHGKGYTFEQGT